MSAFCCAGGLARTAFAVEETPELDAERDQVIQKLIQGGPDFDSNVKRFSELLKKRDAVIATSEAAREARRAESEKERAIAQELRARIDAYTKTADHRVARGCTLSPDPTHPIPSREGYFRGDWGKIVRKAQIRFPPKNELDEGELVTLYDVAGQAGHYIVRGEHADYRDHKTPFVAEVGELVLYCGELAGAQTEKRLPPEWGPKWQEGGYLVRIAAPPKIVRKTKWNPIQVGDAALFWAVHDVKWKYPPDGFLLYNFDVDEELGDNHYRINIDAHRDMSWILYVPPALAKRAPKLGKGYFVWAILGHPVFDKTYKTLVLTAEDFEERYITEK